jgi:hypothetical protein
VWRRIAERSRQSAVISIHAATLAARGGASMSAEHARSRPPPACRFALEVLDVDALWKRAGGDVPFVVELFEDFLGRGVGAPDLLDAAEVRDFAQVQELAHCLKASLVALAATSAATVAGEVELRAATLAIARGAPDTRAIAALSVALLELCERFDEAAEAMRSVMDAATSLTPSVSSR